MGKDALRSRLIGYNVGARFGSPILVLRDLDHDSPCAGNLIAELLPERHPSCLIRVAVRAIEAWLMADVDGLSRAAQLRVSIFPQAPEQEADPKRSFVDLLRQSRSRALRNALDFGGDGPTRQMLGAWTSEFVRTEWDPDRAIAHRRAPSLERCLLRLRSLR